MAATPIISTGTLSMELTIDLTIRFDENAEGLLGAINRAERDVREALDDLVDWVTVNGTSYEPDED